MESLINKSRPEFSFNEYSLINSFKAILACSIGLITVTIFHLPQAQWVLISILIVMAAQYRLGGAIIKGYARLFATLLGSCLASVVIFFFSDHILVVYFMLFIFIGIFIYLASNSKENSYSYTIGAVTMVIILVSTNPQFHNAFYRLFEILVGVTIALLVSRYVFPIHAEGILHKNIIETLEFLKKIYQYSIREEKTFYLVSGKNDLEEEILQNFISQFTLLKEAATESKQIKQKETKYLIFNRLERRLLRSIYMLHYTLKQSLKRFSSIINMQEFKLLHSEVILVIEEMKKKIESKNHVMITVNLNQTYEDIISKIRPLFDQYSFEEKNKIHAFIFCFGHLISVLNQMKKTVLELNVVAF